VPKIKKIKVQPPVAEPKYYAHYDAVTNQIFSINNFRNSEHPHAVEVAFEEYDRLVTGKDKLGDFYIGTVIKTDGTVVNGLVSKKIIQEHNFKNRLLSWIEDTCELADIEIHWDAFNNQWIFVASDNLRKVYYDNKLPINVINFYIVLHNNPNFLLKTIEIDLKKIVIDKVIVPFTSKKESQIEDISLTTNLAVLKYSLNVWKIHEQDQNN
jgi:hypothetical protein